MGVKKSILMAAAMAMATAQFGESMYYDAPARVSSKEPLTKKQKAIRKKNKAAGRARAKARRK